jgi:hypothetical protein
MLVNVPSAAKWRVRDGVSLVPGGDLVLDDAADGGFLRGCLRAKLGCQQSDCKAEENLHASLR